MFDLIYRFESDGLPNANLPKDVPTALLRLEQGNLLFAQLLADLSTNTPGTRMVRVDADNLGIPTADGKARPQEPFAAVMACSDARVPTEMVLGQASNDLFVVRVAGNVLGAECLGSLDYALTNLDSLRLIVVLGHSGCGAVTAAVKAFLDPTHYLQIASTFPLRSIIDRIMVAARTAQVGMESAYGPGVAQMDGYPAALTETTVVLNAALTAATLRKEFNEKLGNREVVYGVYNLASGRVKLSLEPDTGISIRLAIPPSASEGFENLSALVAGSQMVRNLLHGTNLGSAGGPATGVARVLPDGEPGV
ncbi:MAG: carbonic anhydrase [Fimbriiglobus sp.]